jgi:predicted DCC family thiol-disulfide oxidoreductase YuxK
MQEIPTDKKIILFDGVCNLCNRSVQFVLKRDTKGQFVFGSLQSQVGCALLGQLHLPAEFSDSIVLIENNLVYTRSSAVLRVLKTLGRGWQATYLFMLLPKWIRDGLYDWIARNRYQWFGRRQTCMVPDPKWESRFLD